MGRRELSNLVLKVKQHGLIYFRLLCRKFVTRLTHHGKCRATIAQQLAEHAEAVCHHYLPNGIRKGGYWVVGDVSGAKSLCPPAGKLGTAPPIVVCLSPRAVAGLSEKYLGPRELSARPCGKRAGTKFAKMLPFRCHKRLYHSECFQEIQLTP